MPSGWRWKRCGSTEVARETTSTIPTLVLEYLPTLVVPPPFQNISPPVIENRGRGKQQCWRQNGLRERETTRGEWVSENEEERSDCGPAARTEFGLFPSGKAYSYIEAALC
ncbi:hypothetical protein PV325_008915 [Microctonus aethiopoides]|nr:hypothetical protein PV325_008915 [Microctonus aethiopoides]